MYTTTLLNTRKKVKKKKEKANGMFKREENKILSDTEHSSTTNSD
jgi:hypothetical protein